MTIRTVACVAAVLCAFTAWSWQSAPADTPVKGVTLPDPGVAGFRFPESEATIRRWIDTRDKQAMDLHAWGLWQALTSQTNEVDHGRRLFVYETWDSPEDIQTGASNAAHERLVHHLGIPRQLDHDSKRVASQPLVLAGAPGASGTTINKFAPSPSATLTDVKYDPAASSFIAANNLFSLTKLKSILGAGQPSVPQFPVNAIVIKPVYRILTPLIGGRYHLLYKWPGPPHIACDIEPCLSSKFAETNWGQCVWVDTKGADTDGGGVDNTCFGDGSSRTPASTYGLDRFIHFALTKEEADSINKGNPPVPVAGGDIAVLVGMHVTTRETTHWTWQTFWWIPRPEIHITPASETSAATRPASLNGPARHFAECTGYDDVIPARPDVGEPELSLYCYNPYIEAQFGPPPLADSKPGLTKSEGQVIRTANNVGVQTNCMSCHAQANYNPNNVPNAPDYTGARHIDMNGPQFNGVLKLEFLWTIASNAK